VDIIEELKGQMKTAQKTTKLAISTHQPANYPPEHRKPWNELFLGFWWVFQQG
jgi:hypothetical protein